MCGAAPALPSKKLPVGIQNLREIREQDHYYVDKSGLAIDLLNAGKYFFLSRPRRFGKSLLVDTFKELFEGHRALFEGLAAETRWDWSQGTVNLLWQGREKATRRRVGQHHVAVTPNVRAPLARYSKTGRTTRTPAVKRTRDLSCIHFSVARMLLQRKVKTPYKHRLLKKQTLHKKSHN
jgi:Predicted AAA-ATPase